MEENNLKISLALYIRLEFSDILSFEDSNDSNSSLQSIQTKQDYDRNIKHHTYMIIHVLMHYRHIKRANEQTVNIYYIRN